jgi:hypothetical protein
MSPPLLSWRVPTTGDPRLLRLGLAQVGLASIVAALVLVVAAPREWLVPALLGLIPLAIFMAYRRWNAYQRSLEGADNVRIDEAGVHWLDAAGQTRMFRPSEITGFHIGRDEDTLRPVPALTLQLQGGFESQPIELHPPATPEAVRELLKGPWNLAEKQPHRHGEAGDYDAAVFVYSECHDDYQEWHWEGTRDELRRFFGLVGAAADELPQPPPGAKPAQRTILASRREPTRLRLIHTPQIHLDPDTIAGPASVLKQIAAGATATLAGAAESSDVKFDLPLGSRNVWTFHLHVREV